MTALPLTLDTTTLDQALVYGSITNVVGWDAKQTLARLSHLFAHGLDKSAYTDHVGWEYRLLNNYLHCMLADAKNIVANHYAVDGTNILLGFVRKIDELKVERNPLFGDHKLSEILMAVYIGQFTEVQECLIVDDHVKEGGRTLTKRLFDIHGQVLRKDLLRRWLNITKLSTKPEKMDLSIMMALGLQAKTGGRAVGIDAKSVVGAVMTDNLPLLSVVPFPPSQKPLLVARVKLLLLRGGKYWERVKTWYIARVQKLELDFEEYKTFAELMPQLVKLPVGIEAKDVAKFNALTWRLWKNMPACKAYILGFPIQLGTPGIKTIKTALFLLAEVGIEKYAQLMTREKGSPLVRCSYPGLTVPGSEDEGEVKDGGDADNLMGHPFSSYSPFDRLCYIEDDHLFEFTRDEWQGLLKGGKNPRTKTPLINSFVTEVGARMEIAKTYGLPPCKPLAQLLEDAGKGGASDQLPLPDEDAPVQAPPPPQLQYRVGLPQGVGPMGLAHLMHHVGHMPALPGLPAAPAGPPPMSPALAQFAAFVRMMVETDGSPVGPPPGDNSPLGGGSSS